MKTLKVLRRFLVVVGLGCAVSAAVLVVGLRTYTVTIPQKSMARFSPTGLGYIAQIEVVAPPPYSIVSDKDGGTLSELELFEDETKFLKPHSLHQEIDERGEGRYSHWGQNLYFSASDNSDPRLNGHVYSLRVPSVLPVWLWYVLLVGMGAGIFATFPALFRRLCIPLLSLLLTLVGIEVALRYKFPFSDTVWPAKFLPTVGFTFQPNSELRHSNFINFSTLEMVNSLGFLDAEPPAVDKKSNERRIAFLGDSFVEAAQVPIPTKIHQVLARSLSKRHPNYSFRNLAFGFSGAGTAGEISFYREFAHKYAPDLVVLVFTYNDIANNSALLEAVRQGTSPNKPSRVAYEMKADGVSKIAIAPDWEPSKIPIPTIITPPAWRQFGDRFFFGSKFYRWGSARLAWADEKKQIVSIYAERIRFLRRIPELERKLRGWSYPDDLDTDFMFYAESVPEAFSDALQFTREALFELSQELKKSQVPFLVLIDESCYRTAKDLQTLRTSRKILDAGLAKRVEAILVELAIPFVNFRKHLDKKGIRSVTFSHDVHWTRDGHYEASDALLPEVERLLNLGTIEGDRVRVQEY